MSDHEVKLTMMAAAPEKFHEERCLWQRHHAANCYFCEEACPTHAITIDQRKVVLDETRCNGCGVCLSVCPVECFETSDWSEWSLLNTVEKLGVPEVEIVCKAHPAPQEGDKKVPVLQVKTCLGAVSPGMWFELGLQVDVNLRMEYCSKCLLRGAVPYIHKAVELGNSWLESREKTANLNVSTDQEFDSSVIRRMVISAERPILNRRDFLFAFARSSGAPMQAFACLPLEDRQASGKLPPHQPIWLRRLAKAYSDQKIEHQHELDGALEPLVYEAEDDCACASWPTMNVSDHCFVCGTCSQFCPSGALSTKIIDGEFIHSFMPGVCIACGLCEQVCPSKALSRGYAPDPEPFEDRVMAKRVVDVCKICENPTADVIRCLCYWCANEPSMDSLMNDVRSTMLKR